MAEFTKLEVENPIVIPAKEEVVYDKQWISHIRINSTPDKAQVIAHLVPYNGTDIIEEPKEMIVIDNIFQAMQDENRPVELRTLMVQAMEVILQTIKAEKAYQKSVQENITEEDTTPEEPTA